MGRLPDYPYMTAACKHIVVIPRDREYALLLVPRDYHSGHSRGTKGRAILTNGAPFDWGVPTATMQVKTLLTKGSRRSESPGAPTGFFPGEGIGGRRGQWLGGTMASAEHEPIIGADSTKATGNFAPVLMQEPGQTLRFAPVPFMAVL